VREQLAEEEVEFEGVVEEDFASLAEALEIALEVVVVVDEDAEA